MIARIVAIVLRLGGVGGKFIAIIVLVAQSGAGEVGRFTLFFSAVNVLVFVVGLDLYQFVFREILRRRTDAGRLRVLFGQQVFNLVNYCVAATGVWLLVASGLWHFESLPPLWFTLVLITDHAAQELSRIFTILSRPTPANIIYAAKTGAWAWVGVATVLFRDTPLQAQDFYPLWLAANGVSLVYGYLTLRSVFRNRDVSLPPRYGNWLWRGLRISSLFYATSVCTSLLGTLDRFVIARSSSVADVGVYGFWQSVTALIPIVVYAMAGMHFLPKLIYAYQRRAWSDARVLKRRFFVQSLLVSAAVVPLILIVAPIIPVVMDDSAVEPPAATVGLLCLAAVATALWQVPYQALYSANRDTFLASALVSATFLSLASNFVLVPIAGILGAAAVAAVSNIALLWVLNSAARLEAGQA